MFCVFIHVSVYVYVALTFLDYFLCIYLFVSTFPCRYIHDLTVALAGNLVPFCRRDPGSFFQSVLAKLEIMAK